MDLKYGGLVKPTDPAVRVNGVWGEVNKGFVKVAGEWEQFYQRGEPFVGTLVVTGTQAVSLTGISTDIMVEWGDGTTTPLQAGATVSGVSKTLPNGTYTFKIHGNAQKLTFNNAYLTEIVSFGNYVVPWFQFTSATLTKVPDQIPRTITSLDAMFRDCPLFNQNINSWDVSNITTLSFLFYGCTAYNQPLNTWNTSNVIEMISTFRFCNFFNQNLNSWDVSKVTSFGDMFDDCYEYNQPMNNWNTANCVRMQDMFEDCRKFNQDISMWNTNKVTWTRYMFTGCWVFNQNLSGWNLSKVTDFTEMFRDARAFNQPIGNWKVGAATLMPGMFRDAKAFNQNLSGWCVSKIATKPVNFDAGATLWTLPKPVWGTCPVP